MFTQFFGYGYAEWGNFIPPKKFGLFALLYYDNVYLDS